MIHAGTGVSQNPDGKNAAEEAFLKATSGSNTIPSFLLVFATINYEKNGGFSKILDGISQFTKEKYPVIGGTTSGFMTNEGVFSNGVAVMAAYYSESKITPILANNTKSNPIKVAEQVSNQLNESNDSNLKNKLLIEFISGPTIPRFPIVNRLNFVKSKGVGLALTKVGMPLTAILGYGIAKDDIILRKIRDICPDYFIIGGSIIDDGKLFSNFQFFGNRVYTNSLVGLGIQTNEPISAHGALHMEKTKTTFNVTATSAGGTVIDEIDDRPAFEVFKEKLNLSNASFRDQHTLYRTTLFYPVSTSEDVESSTAIGAIYGNHILLGHKLTSNKIELLSASGSRILKMSDSLKNILSKKSGFLYVSACETSCEAVGAKIYRQKKMIDELRNGSPYFITYFGGEHYSRPRETVNVRTHSFNVVSVG